MTENPPFEAYFDFDGTVAPADVLDDIVLRFSANEEWRKAEADWEAGIIGSRTCLERQMSGVRVTEAALSAYLRGVAIDPGFKPIVALLRSKGVNPVIVSDSFLPIISAILSNHGIDGMTILASDLTIKGDIPRVSFPWFGAICTTCGNCKTAHMFKRGRPEGVRRIYIGDGRSDICPAGFCEILFAKGSLLRHYSGLGKRCIPFETLETVHTHLKSLLL